MYHTRDTLGLEDKQLKMIPGYRTDRRVGQRRREKERNEEM